MLKRVYREFPVCLKILRIMRLTLFLFFVSLIQVFSVETYSQSAKLSVNRKNATIKEILYEIESKSDYYFLFNSQLVDVERKVDIDVTDGKIEQVLDRIFKGQDVGYTIMDRQIIIQPSASPAVGSSVQQDRAISGKVTDSSGAPLPGVTVVIKNSTQGTITNGNGSYSLPHVPANATLVFSFVGMKSQEIHVAGKTVINVVMDEETIGIEEVVAIGYGTMKKSDITGSVVSVNMEKKDMSANISLSQALQGYVPGVNASSGGKAGETGTLTIRGQTSLSAGDNPLIVIDGVIFNGSITNININDVESIDILKDASAAAVFGSRSANGVIILTTKRGQSEKPLFNFNASYGFQDISTTKRMDVMNADQYAIRLVDWYYYQSDLLPWYKKNPTDASNRPTRLDITDRDAVATKLRTEEERKNYLAGYDFDWIDKVIQTAPIQNYNLSVSGKTGRTNYYLSASYTDQKGVALNEKFNRTTIRSNFENKITDWLTLGLNTSYAHLDNSGVEGSIETALYSSPLANYTDENGNYPMYLADEIYQQHPIGNYLPIKDQDVKDNLDIFLNAKLDVPKIKGLTYEINYSKNLNFDRKNTFAPESVISGSANKGLAKKAHTEEKGWLMNNIITYAKTFNKRHKVNATLLYSRENREGSHSNLTASGFDNDVLGYNSMESSTNQSLETGAWEENSISYMARLNYACNNRYLLTATFRRDGYSGFGSNNKFGNFPSLALGWIASEEDFLTQIQWLDFLKFRISYGLNGNQGIGRYASVVSLQSEVVYVYDGETAIGVAPSKIGNDDLSWESTASTNIGVDCTIFDQRISGQIDIYSAKTSDVLVIRTLPRATGYASVWDNLGGIKNKGIEIGLETWNIKSQLFNWKTKFVFSLNRNKLTKLYEGVTEDIGNKWFVGHPITAQYDYTVDGVWQEQDLFDGNILTGYYPGQYKLKDLSGEGKISTDDRSVIGYSEPNYRFGINNSFSYNRLSLSFFLNTIQGGDGYYIGENYNVVVAAGSIETGYRTNRTTIRPYWTPDNPVNNAPAMFYNTSIAHGVYEEKSFIRLQDVTVTYDVNKMTLLNNLGLFNLQVYLSGKNLHTWTKWSGWDPELENGGYPMRSIICGIKMSF